MPMNEKAQGTLSFTPAEQDYINRLMQKGAWLLLCTGFVTGAVLGLAAGMWRR